MTSQPLNPEHGFAIELAIAAYGYGVSLYRLESVLDRLGAARGYNVEVMSSGSVAQLIFWQEEQERQHSYFVRLPAANPDLTKLVLTGELADSVQAGDTSPAEGIDHLAEIGGTPARFGALTNALAFGLIGAAVAVIFASPWIDVILGGLLSVAVYGIVILAGRLPWVAKALNFVSALVAAVLATGLAALLPGSNPFVLVLCAIAVFIPGFLLTMGLNDIMLHYTVAGINRLVDGLVITVQLFAGAVIGALIARQIWTVPTVAAPTAISFPVLALFVAVLYVGVGLFFQVRPRDFVWVILVGMLTYTGMTLGNQIGFWQGPFLGAFVLGICGNVFARWRKLPATIVTLPGVMALLPGVVAYIGLLNTVAGGAVQAVTTAAWQILVTVTALLIGVIVANAIVSPKVTL
jgi:uncharacterized membrane protein YjjP (DUF1212 family)